MFTISDDQLRELFGRHCECRPLDLARADDDHASIHDCDTGILRDIQLALGTYAAGTTERDAARERCTALWIAPLKLRRGPDHEAPP